MTQRTSEGREKIFAGIQALTKTDPQGSRALPVTSLFLQRYPVRHARLTHTDTMANFVYNILNLTNFFHLYLGSAGHLLQTSVSSHNESVLGKHSCIKNRYSLDDTRENLAPASNIKTMGQIRLSSVRLSGYWLGRNTYHSS